MATHSSITVKTSNGKFKTVYCHFDGYPEGVGKTLALHYNSQEKSRGTHCRWRYFSSWRTLRPAGRSFILSSGGRIYDLLWS